MAVAALADPQPGAAVAPAFGIRAVDTGFHRDQFDAAWLMVEDGRAAFVDSGTNESVPRLLAALEAAGLGVDAVDWLIATHVHLDHAGGLGRLLTHLPHATVVAHARGVRHLVDPARLVRSATAVYGAAEMERAYGRIVAVPPERIVATHDGMTLELAGRPLRFLDTPGHAMHHHCIWDEASRGVFTGDTFGLSYREFDTTTGPWIMPTTTPVQFQPEALRRSIARLAALQPERLYLTHYGEVGDVPRLTALFLAQLEEMVAAARRLDPGPGRHGALMQALDAIHRRHLRAHGVTLDDARIGELLQLDLELNASGLEIWLDRTAP